MTITKQWCVAASLAGLLGLACSSSPPPMTTPTAGVGTTFPTAGVTGQAVTGTAGVTGPLPAGTAAAPPTMVPCGPKVCMGSGLLTAVFAPCCADQTTGACGTLANGVCTPVPVADPRCPQVTILGQMPAPCCTATGMCGVDGSMLGMGCSDLAQVKLLLPTAPPPQRCDGMPLPMAGDGAQGTSGIGAAGVTATAGVGAAGVGVAAGSGGIGSTAGVGTGGAGGRGTAGMGTAGTATAGMGTGGMSTAGRGGMGGTTGLGGGVSGH